MSEVRKYKIIACVEDGCSYYRDSWSTGVHVTGPELRWRHKVEVTEVVDVRDVMPLVEAARAMRDHWLGCANAGLPMPARLPGDAVDQLIAALAPFETGDGS